MRLDRFLEGAGLVIAAGALVDEGFEEDQIENALAVPKVRLRALQKRTREPL